METYLSPDQVVALIPGITKGQLAQWRYRGEGGPRYRKLGKKIIYTEAEVTAWVESTARTGTAETVSA
jgi:hypothetical protein